MKERKRCGSVTLSRNVQHRNLSNHARLSPPLIRHHYWLPQARPQPHATPGPSPALRSSWQMSDYPPDNPSDQHRQKTKTSVGARTRRSSSSPAALSSRVAVSRTIFSLSRTRFACRMKKKTLSMGMGARGKEGGQGDVGSAATHHIPCVPRLCAFPAGRDGFELRFVLHDLGAVERQFFLVSTLCMW